MKIRCGELRRKDSKKAIRFAIKGMHFDWYLDSRLFQNLYGRYFLFQELLLPHRLLPCMPMMNLPGDCFLK